MDTLKRYDIHRPEHAEPVIVKQRPEGGVQISGSRGSTMWFKNPATVRKIAFAMLDLTEEYEEETKE